MRLDHFLPILTRRKGREARPARWLFQVVSRLVPSCWLSNPQTRQAGLARRWLKWIGPTWLSSPVRRGVQGTCLILFLWFFFYSCWPYRAQPAPVWKGWVPEEVDAETGRIRMVSEEQALASLSENGRVYVFDDAHPGEKPGYLGAFIIQRIAQDAQKSATEGDVATRSLNRERSAAKIVALHLRPEQAISPESLEKLSVSTGPWSITTRPPGQWPSHYADDFARQDRVPVETFLLIDPLVGISTALAAKTWMWSLWGAAIILTLCVLIPRGFCGYLCPLGTVIDLFDWAIAGRVKRFRVSDQGWWVHIKYYLLFGVLVAALGGVLISGFVSAIPVLTRGLLFLLAPLQLGFMRGWHQVPPIDFGQIISIALFFGVLGLGFFRPRFWCKYVCPSGAAFSLGNLFRISERKVEDTCIHCNKCVEICPFDAIKPDFTTRTTDCTLCQTCGGVCPTHAIKFVERSNRVALKVENDPPTHEHSLSNDVRWLLSLNPKSEIRNPKPNFLRRLLPNIQLNSGAEPRWLRSFAQTSIGRRSFVASGLSLLAGLMGGLGASFAVKTFGANLKAPKQWRPVRPPGSVPEQQFLELCIRCGECFKVCPNNVLQPLGFRQGLEGLWTPHVAADWAGCEPSCNACGSACPTGAIRALPLDEKRVARMGLALVNEETCLPLAGKEACQLCVDECAAAGYDAIEFVRVHTKTDAAGKPVDGTGFLAPKVQPDKCVGCGLCQTRCFSINVKTKKLLQTSAIIIEAGDGKEDRIASGSYWNLRVKSIKGKHAQPSESSSSGTQSYLPEFLERSPGPPQK
ncbi:MAG: 4Fe-4S binding protein [Verrucomicrobia bacterium]|nr:4Fe-4S binding protein [Verrucomicrobiota bacterium]